MKEEDIHAEYPSDTDDEYVTEKGFQPTLPGEYTKLSSALALFRLSRVLGKVLEKNYPAATSHELSLQQMYSMAAELDEWQEDLPSHLKLNFVQDKPSTDVTGSRSPLLALAYYYTRTLIYRPAVGSSLGPKAAPAVLSVGESSKHVIQIVQLLEERGMSFSFCLNKMDTLILCGMALLYQCAGLKKDSKLMKDAERLVNVVINTTTKVKAPGWFDFRRVANMLVQLDEPLVATLPEPSPEASRPSTARRASPPAQGSKKKSPQPQALGRLQGASVSEADLLKHQERMRRMTMPPLQQRPDIDRSRSRTSIDGLPQGHDARRGQRHSISQVGDMDQASSTPPQNFDYLSLSNSPDGSSPSSPPNSYVRQHSVSQTPQPPQQGYQGQQAPQKMSVTTSEWETLLGTMDGGLNNVYDAIYGGPALSLNDSTPPGNSYGDWSPESWDFSAFNISDFSNNAAQASSTLSVSEESLSSGEDLSVPGELNLSTGSLEYQNAMLANCTNGDRFIVEPLETNYAL